MLKRSFMTFILASFVVAAGFAMAQNADQQAPAQNEQAPPPGGEGHGHMRFDPEHRTQMLTKQLKLNSDQQAKVLDILKSEQSQMESLRSDTSVSQEDRRSKMMDIHKASSDQIRGLLDANQQKKWDEMQSRREQWQGHRGDMQGTPPPPPSDSQPK